MTKKPRKHRAPRVPRSKAPGGQLTAHAHTPTVWRSLARAAFGDLAGREFQGVRATLRALIDLLPDQSGQGLATSAQIGQCSGLSVRWTRRCLHILEDLGIISYRRGGIDRYGKPCPSWFRVHKNVLLKFIHTARPMREEANRIRREITAKRTAGLRGAFQKRRSEHAALSAHLPTPKGEFRSPLTPGERGITDQLPPQAALYCRTCGGQHETGAQCLTAGPPPGGSLRALVDQMRREAVS